MHHPTLQSSSLFQRWYSLLTNHLLPQLKTGPQCWAPWFPSQGIHIFSLALNSFLKEKKTFTLLCLLVTSYTFNCKRKLPQKIEHLFYFLWRKLLHVPGDELYLASKAVTCDSPLLWQHRLFHRLHLLLISANQESFSLHLVLHWCN